MAASRLLANMKIKTKIVVSFFGLVLILSSLLSLYSAYRLRTEVYKEFLNRAQNDILSFTAANNDSLTFGDTDPVLKT